VINDAVLQENSYIGFRQLSLAYRVPKNLCNKIGISSANVTLFGRDLGFLYKTLKDNLHPFSVRGNEAGSAHEWQQIPYVRTLGVSLDLSL
jgi:iron complex outermembrane receptor protein